MIYTFALSPVVRFFQMICTLNTAFKVNLEIQKCYCAGDIWRVQVPYVYLYAGDIRALHVP